MPEAPGPFQTVTVARIYAQQGKLEQARAIYRLLLADEPSNTELARALASVERQLATERSPHPEEGNTVRLSKEGAALFCSWRVSAEAVDDAQRALGAAPGDLTLRVVGFPQDPRRGAHDVDVDRNEGGAHVPSPADAAFVVAAVGLMDSEGTFVSIAHSDILPL